VDGQIPGHFYLLWKGFSYSQLAFIQVLIFPRHGRKLEMESIASGIKMTCNSMLLESQLSHKLHQLFKKDAEQDDMRPKERKKKNKALLGRQTKLPITTVPEIVFF